MVMLREQPSSCTKSIMDNAGQVTRFAKNNPAKLIKKQSKVIKGFKELSWIEWPWKAELSMLFRRPFLNRVVHMRTRQSDPGNRAELGKPGFQVAHVSLEVAQEEVEQERFSLAEGAGHGNDGDVAVLDVLLAHDRGQGLFVQLEGVVVLGQHDLHGSTGRLHPG